MLHSGVVWTKQDVCRPTTSLCFYCVCVRLDFCLSVAHDFMVLTLFDCWWLRLLWSSVVTLDVCCEGGHVSLRYFKPLLSETIERWQEMRGEVEDDKSFQSSRAADVTVHDQCQKPPGRPKHQTS